MVVINSLTSFAVNMDREGGVANLVSGTIVGVTQLCATGKTEYLKLYDRSKGLEIIFNLERRRTS